MESKECSAQESTSTSEPELPSLKSESEHLLGATKDILSSSCQTPLNQSSHFEEAFTLPSGSRSHTSIELVNRSTQTLQPGCRRIRSASFHNDHTEKKIVRFADSLGLDLAKIKRFRGTKEPKVPVSAFADLNLTPPTAPLSVVKSVCSTDSITPEVVTKVTKLVFVPQFHDPVSDPYFKTKLKEQKVCLESVVVGQDEVVGIIRTLNLGYKKLVQVRFSMDGWITYGDMDAEYMPGSTKGDSDKFTFNIPLPPLHLGEKLIFSVKYEVNGQEYWDNNYSDDFVIKCVVQEA